MREFYFAAFCAFFGAVYEAFSFGVFSFFMIYSFAAPFIGGMLLLILYKKGKVIRMLSIHLLHMTTVTTALWFIAAGVVEIYGSENHLLLVYPFPAAILFIAMVISLVLPEKKETAPALQE